MIKELIQITNEKSLVLFTSKKDMDYVYKHLGNLGNINIYVQKDGSSQDKIWTRY